MSFDLTTQRTRRPGRPLWSGAAFIVEALLLLVFLIASLAIFTQLFAASAEKSIEADELSRAVAAASSVAERFAADPSAVAETNQADDLTVTCDITKTPRANGMLYEATISVYDDAQQPGDVNALYTITTARYESEVS